MNQPIAAPSNSAYKGAWGVLILLFFVNLLNFIDRTIPSVVLEPIRKEFDLTDTQLGLLGTAFTLIYAIVGLPLGRLADTWHRKYVLAGGVAVWSGFTALSGMMSSFVGFFMVRLGVGVVAMTLGAYCLLVAGPLVFMGLMTPQGGDMGRLALLFFAGLTLFYMYYVSVYTAVQDVVEPRLRASAMAIYFAAQYLLGAAFGSLLIGRLSDMFANQAMFRTNAYAMTEVFRGVGLHDAMFSVPFMLFATAVSLWLASRSYLVDVERVKSAASV